MLTKITRFGYILIASKSMPRYLAVASTLLACGSLAESMLKRRLLHIVVFYLYAEEAHAEGYLDDSLGSQDLSAIEELLGSYFVTLRNVPVVRSSTKQGWGDVVAFVRDISERLFRSPNISDRFDGICVRLERLERLYGQQRIAKRTNVSFVRALPAAVLTELLDIVSPGNEVNLFKSQQTQWRGYYAFLLWLNQGLRRGEAPSVRASFLKTEQTTSGRQYWLNVQSSESEDDPRISIPSIKTPSSIGQIPVSPILAQAFYTEIEKYIW